MQMSFYMFLVTSLLFLLTVCKKSNNKLEMPQPFNCSLWYDTNIFNKSLSTVDSWVEQGNVKAIHILARCNFSSKLESLLQNKVAADSLDLDGQTPLMYAAEAGAMESIKVLLSFGANINTENEYHETALIYAIRNERIDAARVLIESGANCNVINFEGQSISVILKNLQNHELTKVIGKMCKINFESEAR